jgi:hypothetical protein
VYVILDAFDLGCWPNPLRHYAETERLPALGFTPILFVQILLDKSLSRPWLDMLFSRVIRKTATNGAKSAHSRRAHSGEKLTTLKARGWVIATLAAGRSAYDDNSPMSSYAIWVTADSDLRNSVDAAVSA